MSIVHCRTNDEVAAAIRAGGAAAVVWQMTGRTSHGSRAATIHAAVGSKPLLIDLELAPATAREVANLARLRAAEGWPLEVAPRGFDDLSAAIEILVRDGAAGGGGAQGPIIQRLTDDQPDQVSMILIAAAVAGGRRLSIRTLATLTRCAPRTLQWLLHRAGLPAPHDFLGYILALHTVWRIDILRWPVSRAAERAGFASTAALSRYVSRHTGDSPTRLRDNGGFWALLEQAAACVSPERPKGCEQ